MGPRQAARNALIGHSPSLRSAPERLNRLVFGELASHYPVAGALYQHSKYTW